MCASFESPPGPNQQPQAAKPMHSDARRQIHGGQGFTLVEDFAFAKVWEALSEDPTIAAGRKGEDFFKAINKVYNEKCKLANC